MLGVPSGVVKNLLPPILYSNAANSALKRGITPTGYDLPVAGSIYFSLVRNISDPVNANFLFQRCSFCSLIVWY